MNTSRQYSLHVGEVYKNRYRVYLWGQPNGHIMDWRGTNYRYKAVDYQPRGGFTTIAEAEAWAHRQFPNKEALRVYTDRCGDGSWLSEDKAATFVKDIDV